MNLANQNTPEVEPVKWPAKPTKPAPIPSPEKEAPSRETKEVPVREPKEVPKRNDPMPTPINPK